MGVNDALKEKYATVIRQKRTLFQQDNVKPHTAEKNKEKIYDLEGVEILSRPTHSTDATSSDCGTISATMQNFLRTPI
ncbi:hypothetical protein KIN20_024276 [Parelaphostrongylus tenuis]|uniref:Transposase n=1 Tax=Parelaphostrongylus tenuis TaxID=148309 RepID=A0AAD5MTA2_PARTN|nr:hypothetical protein KIN20_024276 [Parelaphostrongylus tenuis]